MKNRLLIPVVLAMLAPASAPAQQATGPKRRVNWENHLMRITDNQQRYDAFLAACTADCAQMSAAQIGELLRLFPDQPCAHEAQQDPGRECGEGADSNYQAEAIDNAAIPWERFGRTDIDALANRVLPGNYGLIISKWYSKGRPQDPVSTLMSDFQRMSQPERYEAFVAIVKSASDRLSAAQIGAMIGQLSDGFCTRYEREEQELEDNDPSVEEMIPEPESHAGSSNSAMNEFEKASEAETRQRVADLREAYQEIQDYARKHRPKSFNYSCANTENYQQKALGEANIPWSRFSLGEIRNQIAGMVGSQNQGFVAAMAIAKRNR